MSPNEQVAQALFQTIKPNDTWSNADHDTHQVYRRRAMKLRSLTSLPTQPDDEDKQALAARAWKEGYVTGIHDAKRPLEPGRTINPYKQPQKAQHT